MDASLYSAASGMAARMQSMDLLANDLANTQTAGYRAERPFFEELKAAGGRAVRLAGSYSGHEQGQLRPTGEELDLALEGEGYFVIQTPAGERYTRNGQFRLSPDGVLSDTAGQPVLGEAGPVQLGSGHISIAADGTVQDTSGPGGKLRIVKFPAGAEPVREGNSLLAAPPNAKPEPDPETSVRQGSLEQSNVSGVEAMIQMIQTLRLFEANSRAVRALDGIDHKAAAEIGRTNL
jgi:flagellar basal-body rod protein FlgF